MIIRKANAGDVPALVELYHSHLTYYPPKEAPDLDLWRAIVERFESSDSMYLLIAEEDGAAVSTVQMAIIENLTHGVSPFAVIENVVTHPDYRQRGFASALLKRATEIAREHHCYKLFLETGSNRESTLNFYRRNGFEIDSKHSCLKRL
ncbi:MAG: GNAT family N-acetyltransferase [Clostridia bacterium]|nr:GNAT family N-acetyltransferase [Clostridia bacterium]